MTPTPCTESQIGRQLIHFWGRMNKCRLRPFFPSPAYDSSTWPRGKALLQARGRRKKNTGEQIVLFLSHSSAQRPHQVRNTVGDAYAAKKPANGRREMTKKKPNYVEKKRRAHRSALFFGRCGLLISSSIIDNGPACAHRADARPPANRAAQREWITLLGSRGSSCSSSGGSEGDETLMSRVMNGMNQSEPSPPFA